MREIRFKAKRIDNGEWVEGWILKDEITGQYFIHASGNSVNESDKVNEEGCLQFVAFEVDENTISQYTGLTDKNGNKIWENDIVVAHFRSNKSRQKFKIIFEDGMFLFDNSCVEVPKYDVYGIEVIGNIFDNADLLKG